MKLFNLNYLIQNLKKSKNILAISICLVPILNTIILIMTLTSNYNHILTFSEISITNLIGIYILPIVISTCLFNYIYKKQSVDFINSMPISRKSIFITNTILGIIIFTIMLLVNTILTYTTCLIFNSPIPFMMLFDYFWFYLVVYIFAFTTTNLAMTISGNTITQIILTILLFFLIPFISFYTTTTPAIKGNLSFNLIECNEEACKPVKYFCYNDKNCEKHKELNKYYQDFSPVIENNYTLPFNLLANTINYSKTSIISTISVIKMLILSIIYTILGYILFLKRKMEVTETTFKNPHIHNLVKSLTLVPVIAITYEIVKSEKPIFMIFAIVILLIYYFVYDLITKKSIQNIKLSCIYFILTTIILTTTFNFIDKPINYEQSLNYNEIKEIAIDLSDYLPITNKEKLYIDNKEIISLITKSMLNTEHEHQEFINLYIKTTNNKEYNSYVGIDTTTYSVLLDFLETENDYLKHYKNININEVYAITIGNKIYNKEEAQPILKLIEKTLNNLTLKEYFNLQQKYGYINDEYYIKLYTYNNHESQLFEINGYINYDLLNKIVNIHNLQLKDHITPIIPDNYSLYYKNAYLKEYYNIDFYVIRSAKKELYEFILKNINDKVDMKKEFFIFNITINGIEYTFTTNKVQEVKELLTKKYNEIKDQEEYQKYYQEESVEYYD